LLIDIIVIAICAVISGADGWVSIEEYGRAKLEWLGTLLELPNGIPSHDTFGRVFAALDPKAFQRCYLTWVRAVAQVTNGQVVAIDGKTVRRSHDRRLGKDAIRMVSAWASENRLVLGQVKVDDKSNEITAIPELLRVLEVRGCIVTIDAIGCQKGIAKTITEQGGDYVLAVKKNQGRLYEEVRQLFDYGQSIEYKDTKHDYHQTVDKGHGRIEIRRCWTIDDPDYLLYLRDREKWQGIRSIAMVVGERRIGDKVSIESRYYISSLECNAEMILRAVRDHWGIENSLHWVLDIAFREDESRIRTGNGAQSFAILRRIALSLLKQERTAKCGLRTRRLKAAWDNDYLLKVLSI
jgi:predicted transposase YbfD/YdcC